MANEKVLQQALFVLRVGIMIVFVMWTIDKFANYKHFSGMFAHYYWGIKISQPVLLMLGVGEVILLMLFFFTNYFKKWTYGIILVAHLITTLISFHRLLPPYEIHQLLYFGSIPLLCSCIALFLLRDEDTLFKFGG